MSRRRSTATTRGPAGLRWAAIVYVVVVLLGVAATGAQAYWSQSGTVVANVTTGKWGPQQPVTRVKCSAKKDGRLGTDLLVVEFTAPSDADEVEVAISRNDREEQKKMLPVTSTDSLKANFSVATGFWVPGYVDLSITPSYAGTLGLSAVHHRIEVRNYGFFVTASC